LTVVVSDEERSASDSSDPLPRRDIWPTVLPEPIFPPSPQESISPIVTSVEAKLGRGKQSVVEITEEEEEEGWQEAVSRSRSFGGGNRRLAHKGATVVPYNTEGQAAHSGGHHRQSGAVLRERGSAPGTGGSANQLLRRRTSSAYGPIVGTLSPQSTASSSLAENPMGGGKHYVRQFSGRPQTTSFAGEASSPATLESPANVSKALSQAAPDMSTDKIEGGEAAIAGAAVSRAVTHSTHGRMASGSSSTVFGKTAGTFTSGGSAPSYKEVALAPWGSFSRMAVTTDRIQQDSLIQQDSFSTTEQESSFSENLKQDMTANIEKETTIPVEQLQQEELIPVDKESSELVEGQKNKMLAAKEDSPQLSRVSSDLVISNVLSSSSSSASLSAEGRDSSWDGSLQPPTSPKVIDIVEGDDSIDDAQTPKIVLDSEETQPDIQTPKIPLVSEEA
jgi:hypothetical protein